MENSDSRYGFASCHNSQTLPLVPVFGIHDNRLNYVGTLSYVYVSAGILSRWQCKRRLHSLCS